jgi:epoxyqueuosine reductase
MLDNWLMDSLTAIIKKKALELGFCKVGIVHAERLADESEHFFEWLKLGYNGEMSWMNREPEKRLDPKLIFPEAKSIIVVAMNYFTPLEHDNSTSTGKISRYAWGDDYHDVLREKLKNLLEWINQQAPHANGKICVDITPIMEKGWAVRAGIGWLGKHSNLITTDHGSWVFLSEVILNIELEFDTATVPDHCGSCTACLEACPTQAIVEPYIVDSRKCISYATIELRDETLPREVAANLNGWLYGCDICQDVCPWNRFEKPATEPRFEPRNSETSILLDSVQRMELKDYAERFRGSAVKRAKLSGLKRNASALANNVSKTDA